MKSKKIIILLVVLTLIPLLVHAKSYSYDYVNVVLDFQKNGSIIVSQERAYDFRGSFSWAFMDLEKKGAEDIDFLMIKDLDKEEILTFETEEDSSHVKATWHYKAQDEVKRFLIVYEVKGGIKRYEDVAEFYWKVIENTHEFIDNFKAEIILPEESPNLFKVFVHSRAKPGEINFSGDYKKATVTVEDVPKNSFVEFRLLMSPSVFPNVPLQQKKMYENILQEERKAFSRNPIVVGKNIFLYCFIFFIPFILLIFFYWKYGREPKVDYDRTYEHDPPRDIPPMALANIFEARETSIRTAGQGLLGTIFDLARRGYLEIKEEKVKTFFGLRERTRHRFILTKKGEKELNKITKTLLSFEKSVLLFFFKPKTKTVKEVTTDELKSRATRHQTRIRSKILKISKDAREWFEKNYFPLRNRKSEKMRKYFTIFTILFYFISCFFFLSILPFYGFYLILGSIFSGIILVILAKSISQRTPEATLEVKRWQAFKRFISDFSAMKDAPPTLLHIWDQYLVYAIVLGVAQKLLENIKNLSLERKQAVAGVIWYHGTTPTPTGTISPESFSILSNSLSSTISALSSSTSVGGGFSGGGGGGGGGGSSGAG